jgi:hypothetical protein
MGNSAPSAIHDGYRDDDDYAEQFDGIETLGYRVLGVQPNSPGKEGRKEGMWKEGRKEGRKM